MSPPGPRGQRAAHQARDPVTGSAHCQLIPYWSKILKKKQFIFWCASKSKKNVLRGIHLQRKFWKIVANQIVNKGELETKAWLSGMISNVSQPFFPGDISIVRAVSKRKCGIGIVNHYYVARMLAGINGRRDALYAKRATVLTPNPAHVNISAGGVAKYATNKNEAIKLLEFLASPEGSKGLAAPTFEHPLKEVNQNEIVKNFGDFTPDRVTVEDLGEKNSLAIKLMRDAGWD